MYFNASVWLAVLVFLWVALHFIAEEFFLFDILNCKTVPTSYTLFQYRNNDENNVGCCLKEQMNARAFYGSYRHNLSKKINLCYAQQAQFVNTILFEVLKVYSHVIIIIIFFPTPFTSNTNDNKYDNEYSTDPTHNGYNIFRF